MLARTINSSFNPILLLTLVVAAILPGQEYRGRITGVVTDPSGAAVLQAKVSVLSKATGVTTTAQTNSAGLYSVNFLQPGEYDLSVEYQGFKTFERKSIILQSGQVAEVNVALELGPAEQSVEVVAEAALLETATASRGNVVNSQLISELAIPGRNPVLLANTQPGVTYRGVGIFYQPFANGALINMSINGGLPGNNELQVDGAPNNSSARAPNNIAFVPPGEAVQEVAISTNGYDASFGKTSGGVVNIVMKGGTSDFHGTGWSYLRRRAWNANRFQFNANNVPKPPQGLEHWGTVLSGPLFVPGLLTKKSDKKLFWLFSFEDFRETQPAPFAISVPEPEMLNGDFSKLTDPSGRLIPIYDPLTLELRDGVEQRRQFPGNIIPQERISQIAKNILSYFPKPNTPTPAGRRYSQNNFVQPDYAYDLPYRSYMGRVDTVFTESIRFNTRYAFTNHEQVRTDNGITGPGTRGFDPYLRQNHAALFDYVQTLNPTTVLNLRANLSRYVEGSNSTPNLNFDSSTLGFPEPLLRQLAIGNFFGSYNFDGYAGMGPEPSGLLTDYTTTYSLQGTLNKVINRHQLKIGGDLRRSHVAQMNLGWPFLVGTNGQFTSRAYANDALSANTGDAIASFLLGAPVFFEADWNVRPFFRQWYFAPYIQDDWTVNSRLTLNLGLRWDLNTTPDERYDRLMVGFNPALPSPLTGQIPADRLAQYPFLQSLRGDFQYAGQNGARTTASEAYLKTLQPRAGFAYQLSSRLVMRGGYGMFFANWPTLEYFRTEGFSTSTFGNISADNGRTPRPDLMTNPFPQGITVPSGTPSTSFFLGRNQGFWNPQAKLPRVHQYSLGFQFRVTSGSVIDASYVGSRTQNNFVQRPINLPSDEFMRQCDPLRGGQLSYCNAAVPNPFVGLPQLAQTALGQNANTSRYQLNRPFPQYDGDMVQLASNDGRTWYDSAQISYRTRFQSGVVIDANYTLSKFLLEGDGYFNQYAGQLQRGLAAIDRTHVFKLSGHYELPFGPGKKWLSGSNGLISRLAGGWEVNSMTIIGSGEPANLPGNTIMLKDPRVPVDKKQYRVRGWNGCVAQLLPGGGWTPVAYSVQRNGCSPTDLSDYAWGVVPGGTLIGGTTLNPFRSGQIRMPGTSQTDLSVNKTTQITEKLRVQLRVEAFNAFNTYNLFQIRYNNNPYDPNFGTYFPGDNSSTFSPQSRDSLPRNIQLGLKLIW